jgi:predicted kinase
MRRLPDDASLQLRLQRGAVSDRELEQLAQLLASFSRQQPPLTLLPERVRDELIGLIRDNQLELTEYCPDWSAEIQRLHAAQIRYVTVNAGLLDGRVCDGRYIEGHGDLRPEHVYLLKKPVVIDCVEFSERLRQIDIADELSFLAMECDQLGQPAAGQRILDSYGRATSDHPPASLVAFYKTYRACVRAKVHAIRSHQAVAENECRRLTRQAGRYLALAKEYEATFRRGLLVAVCGLMGTGKSSLANPLADHLGGTLLRTDEIRREVFGSAPQRVEYGQGIYGPTTRDAIYDTMFARAAELIRRGGTVIVDATFQTARQRQRLHELGQRCGADVVVVHCHCPRIVALGRLLERQRGSSLSDGRAELYDHQAAQWETDSADDRMVQVDTRRPNVEQVQTVLSAIAALPRAADKRI